MSCFNNVADSRYETLQKPNLTEDIFLQILRTFQNNIFLKNFVWLPLDGLYLFCRRKDLQNTCKTFLKTSSLFAENYLVNRNSSLPQILRNFLEYFKYWLFLLNVFYSCPILFYFLSFDCWIQYYELFLKKNGTRSRAVFRTLSST